jgi:hypothetical protein
VAVYGRGQSTGREQMLDQGKPTPRLSGSDQEAVVRSVRLAQGLAVRGPRRSGPLTGARSLFLRALDKTRTTHRARTFGRVAALDLEAGHAGRIQLGVLEVSAGSSPAGSAES